VAFATSEVAADLDDGWPYLRDAVMALGMAPSVVFWDDPAVEWGAYDVTVAIYTWATSPAERHSFPGCKTWSR